MTKQILFVIVGLVLAVQLSLAQEAFHTEYPAIGIAATLWGRKVSLMGGFDGFKESNRHDQLHLFNGEGWQLKAESLTAMNSERSLTPAITYQDYVFVWGEVEGTEIIQIMGPEHNESSSDWLYEWTFPASPNGPEARVGHTVVLYDEEFYLFGGWSTKSNRYMNDLWKADITGPEIEWTLIHERAPLLPRAFHSAVLYQDSIYFFAGSTKNEKLLNDVWRFDVLLSQWVRCFVPEHGLIPPPREAHTAVYFANEAFYVWGGRGEDGFLNDMWAFSFQTESWKDINQGLVVPRERGYLASVVLDEQLVIFGGKIADEQAPTEFWSPETRYIPIWHPDDYSGEVWAFDFCEEKWEYVGCLFNVTDSEDPEMCRSYHAPKCPNDCSGNGVCVSEGVCVCRGQWKNDDCSWNVCDFDKHRGYTVQLMDRVLISEAILKLGKELRYLKDQLNYVRERLPSYDEYLQNLRGGEQDIGQIYTISTSVEGVRYHSTCMTDSLLPIFSEFNEVLEDTKDNEPFYTPYTGTLGNI